MATTLSADTKTFADRIVKRGLSRYEKSSLPTTTGRALILPSEPNTEVEELVGLGYPITNLLAVERDLGRYEALVAHYWDTVHVKQVEVGAALRKIREPVYSYIHLDYCAHFGQDQAEALRLVPTIAAPVARVRVSVLRSRRQPGQFTFEDRLRENLLLGICNAAYTADPIDAPRWQGYADAFTSYRDDTTTLMVGLLTAAAFLGSSGRKGFVARGTHSLSNVQRYMYNEPGVPNTMFTAWADLTRLEPGAPVDHEAWVLDELAKVFDELTYPAPMFSPQMYIGNGNGDTS